MEHLLSGLTSSDGHLRVHLVVKGETWVKFGTVYVPWTAVALVSRSGSNGVWRPDTPIPAPENRGLW